MPLIKHAYYMKDDTLFSEFKSARDEYVHEASDFYKGAQTSKSIKSKRNEQETNDLGGA